MQVHRRTDENGWLKESVEPFHSEREEIESVPNILFFDLEDIRGDLIHFHVTLAVLQIFDDKIH